ncbi:sugar transferase [Dyadobacter sandarakinus]|uniref:Sugar transferase n=1 Tax=Dyadobacter sandarakinus TaxID=2747268 RepID=A0ABX7IBG5_9BACT|nr:sugar transferase [Dyadobacter sandarakinus]QRR03058.1 sugar transferase [Dyadobacter sandarakinus]
MTYLQSGKRFLDVFAAVAGMIILSPLFLVLTLLLAAVHSGSPLFFQPRPGLHGKIFIVVKFRTICQHSGRASPFCRWLRRSSLDEIPQLWNILKGEMSFVGPRPLLPEYLPAYNAYQQQRHNMRPGLTGWAQINGRDRLSWEQKCELDVWYVHNASLSLDIHIFLKTIFTKHTIVPC